MNKQQLLDALTTTRARWDALLEEAGEDRLTEPGVIGHWSLKDLVAHLTWAERETVSILRQRALVGVTEDSLRLWRMSHDERNEILYEQNRDRSLSEILAESGDVHRDLVAAVKDLSEEDLHDPSRFQGMPAEWIPWQVIAANSFRHVRHHIEEVRAWLDAQ